MANTQITTHGQIEAFVNSFPGLVQYDEAAAAIDACREALDAGALPIHAANAAAATLYNGYAGFREETRQVCLVETVTALMHADRVDRIGPVGFLTLGSVQ